MKVIVNVVVKNLELAVEDGTTMGELKVMIHQQHGVHVDQQRLFLKGRPIYEDDSTTLSELGVKDGDHIHLILSYR